MVSGVGTGGEFDFEVNDGVNFASRGTFRLTTGALHLTASRQRPLEAFPGLTHVITHRLLAAATNDPNRTHPVVYTLQTKPSHGVLSREAVGGRLAEVTTFTQEDIDEGRISYRYTGSVSMTAVSPTWHGTDSFDYELSTSFAQSLPRRTFQVDVAYYHVDDVNRASLIEGTAPTVPEGGSVTFGTANVDPSPLLRRLRAAGFRLPAVTYVVRESPQHGTLLVEGRNATAGSGFSQRDVELGHVTYTHDDSETTADWFAYSVQIDDGGVSGLGDQRNRFDIGVTPINDRPFELQTAAPSIDLVQGFLCNITRQELCTVDPDTAPDQLRYQVVNGPSNGYVALAGAEDTAVARFTQADIDDGRVLFVHDGSVEPGAFYFRVSDGHFKALYKVFNVHVRPLTLELVNASAVRIMQGQAAAAVTARNLAAETNGDRAAVTYNVTRHPRHGRLYLDDVLTASFTQGDIDFGRVAYVQTDMAAASDDFSFVVFDARNVVVDRTLAVQVRALVRRPDHPFRADADGDTTLTLDALDASELAMLTDSDPVYTLTRQPRRGTLVRRTDQRAKRDTDDPLERFSHSEVVGRVISYRATPSESTDDVEDTMSFRLTAVNVQPALSSLRILVVPRTTVAAPTVAATAGTVTALSAAPSAPTTVASVEVTTTYPFNNVGTDHLIVIFLVSGITIIVIVVFIAVKCVRRRRRRREKEEDDMMAMDGDGDETKYPLTRLGEPDTRRVPYGGYEDGRQVAAGGYGVGRQAAAPRSLTQPLFDRPQAYDALPLSVYPSSPRGQQHPDEARRRPSTPTVRVRAKSPPPSALSRQTSSSPAASESHTPLTAVRLPTAHSPYLGRSEVSRTVPQCRVTPLSDTEESDAGGSVVGRPGPAGEATATPEQASFDWDSVDPELLQHCRTTNPILHKSKYWV